MFDVGGGELLLILMAVLLLFGPSKLPELARSFGKGMAQFRRAQTEFQRNLNSISGEIESTIQDPPAQTLSPRKYDVPPDLSSAAEHLITETPSAEQPTVHIRPAEESVARTTPPLSATS